MFERGTLWRQVQAKTSEALREGVLSPIASDSEFIEDAGVRFLVRTTAGTKPKGLSASPAGPDSSPFLRYEPALHVADISPTHACRLNRFPLVEHHLLIVTREFQEQEAPLNQDDFTALWTCMREYEALAFYNGGAAAGASQGHKHLQMVPLPLAATGPRIPLEPLIVEGTGSAERGARSGGGGTTGRIERSVSLPFRHARVRLRAEASGSPEQTGEATAALYREMLRFVGLDPTAPRPGAYNLLVTREWMLLVPRSQESYRGISLNSLAFAGTLLVKDREQLSLLKQAGPMTALRAVTAP